MVGAWVMLLIDVRPRSRSGGSSPTLETVGGCSFENGVRKASPGTYAMLENKLAWAPGSIDTILAGGEPKEVVVELRRPTPNAPSRGYALRPTNPHALSHVSTEELLLELRRRIIAARDTRQDTWDDWGGGLAFFGRWLL